MTNELCVPIMCYVKAEEFLEEDCQKWELILLYRTGQKFEMTYFHGLWNTRDEMCPPFWNFICMENACHLTYGMPLNTKYLMIGVCIYLINISHTAFSCRVVEVFLDLSVYCTCVPRGTHTFSSRNLNWH